MNIYLFSFGEKIDFVYYCQQVLNLIAYHVPKITLYIQYFFKKKDLIKNFLYVFIYSDIWSDNRQVHSCMSVIVHYINNN